MHSPSPARTRARTSAAHLRIDGVSVSFGERRVLTAASLLVAAGERTGLIGENGSGKSTLLRIAAGIIEPDAGTVEAHGHGAHDHGGHGHAAHGHGIAGHGTHGHGTAGHDAAGGPPTIGLLHQEPPFAAADTVAVVLADAVAPARAAAVAVDAAASALALAPDDPERATAYADALERAEREGAWDADARAEAMLAGLGLAAVDRGAATGELSGGQRARLALTWLLLRTPDILLLDEPTNHLDDAAVAHLRGVLHAWRGPVLLASHDRAFLDEVATSLVDLDPAPAPAGATDAPITTFRGTYTAYLAERARARERWTQRFGDEQHELARLRGAVHSSHAVGHAGAAPRTEGRAAAKFYADRNARVVSRRVADARSRLERLEREQVRKPPVPLRFAGIPASARHRGAGPLLTASGLEAAGRMPRVSLAVSPGERMLVEGANGSGKSTLLAVLAGRLAPSAGTVQVAPGARIGLLTQHTELPDPRGAGATRTAGEAYRDAVGAERADAVPLADFGLIAPRDQNRPVAVLSVGQQRRLALAAVLADPPDVLLLDEPTNHLSLALAGELENALADHPGAVVVASHDRWLRERWSGMRLHLR